MPHYIISSHFFDANNDGKIDLIIGHKDSDNPSDILLLNRGEYFEISPLAIPTHYLGIHGETVNLNTSDFNGDGHLDIIATTVDGREKSYYQSSKIHLYLGDGLGHFKDASDQIQWGQTNHWIEWIRVADFDGDGDSDFLITDPGGNKDRNFFGGSIFLNDGSAYFKKSRIHFDDGKRKYQDFRLSWSHLGLKGFQQKRWRFAMDVLIGDLNQDGLPDLFSPGGEMPGVMASFINKSTPHHLEFHIVYSSMPVIIKSGSLLDINQDSFPDLIAADSISPTKGRRNPIHYFLNNQKGQFTHLKRSPLPGVQHARQWLSADFDKNGKKDIFIADHGFDFPPHSGDSNLLLLQKNESGFLMTSSAFFDGKHFTHGASLGDVNNDGLTDLFLNNQTGRRLWINQGNGRFKGFSLKLK